MKTPLRYQVTHFDCGTATFINALMYLFERDEIPQEVVEYVTMVTGDRNLGLGGGHGGTSAKACSFLAAWCNDYVAERSSMPIRCQALEGPEEVSVNEGSALVEGIASGAVAMTECCLGADHYVLITGIDEKYVYLWDPYYDTWPLHELDAPVVGVQMDWDHPHEYNRVVERWVLEEPAGTPYSLEAKCGRDAVLVWRTDGVA
jgi:hypothetical protein